MKRVKIRVRESLPQSAINGFNQGRTLKQIDEGWRRFWARRGYDPPPPVNTYQVGAFILPNGHLEDIRTKGE